MKIPFQLNVLYFDKGLRPLKLHGSCFQKSDGGTSFRQRFPLHRSLILVENNQNTFSLLFSYFKVLILNDCCPQYLHCFQFRLSLTSVRSGPCCKNQWNRILVPFHSPFHPSDPPYLNKVSLSFTVLFSLLAETGFLIAHTLEKVFALITLMVYDWDACVVNVWHFSLFTVSEIY